MLKRIQFKRQKGFRLPPNSVRVTRPSRFGNPYKIGFPRPFERGNIETIEEVIQLFEDWIMFEMEGNPKFLEPLRCKNLACFCPLVDKYGDIVKCHADILLDYANR